MLSVKGLHIQFGNKVVIEQGDLVIQNGRLCLIQSPSGTGKSSIFELLSLNKLDLAESFQIDDQNIKASDEKAINELKLHDVAFVNQKAELLEHMSVKEQLAFSCKLNQNSSRKMNEIIKKLRLTKLKNKKVKKLSGGERQRVALASAFLKDARLLILDEPTAMQDDKNKKTIVSLIDEAVQQGKMVVVATHEHGYFHDYDEYTIDNKKLKVIQLKKANIEKEETNTRKAGQLSSIKSFLSKCYLVNFPVINTVYLLVFSISIALVIGMLSLGQGNVKEQTLNISDIYQTELFVTNPLPESPIGLDSERNLAISSDVIEKIKEVDHVLSVEPYLYLLSNPVYYVLTEDGVDSVRPSSHLIEAIQDNRVIAETSFEEIYSTQNVFGVEPYYAHQRLEDRCDEVNDAEGVYISRELADYLNIDNISGVSLHFQIGIYIGESPSAVLDENGNQTRLSRSGISVLTDLTYPIKGVLNENIVGNYGLMNQSDIYLSAQEIEKMQIEYQQKNQELLDVMSTEPAEYVTMNTTYPLMMCMKQGWQASAYVVNIDSPEAVDDVVRSITAIDSNLNATVTKAFANNGLEISQDAANTVKQTVYMYSVLIVLALLMGLTIMNYLMVRMRKKDLYYLQQNGLSDQDLTSIHSREYLWKFVISIPVTILFTYLIMRYLKSYVSYPISFGEDLIFLSVILYLIVFILTYCLYRLMFSKTRRSLFKKRKT